MDRQSWLLNLSLSKAHPALHAIFLTRFISIVSPRLLGMAVPVQIRMIIQSTWQVDLSVTLTGNAMFISLVVGGVLADRYERKKVILLAHGTCSTNFIDLCLGALLPESSLLAIYLFSLWNGSFALLGMTALLAATPALVGCENSIQARTITMLTMRLESVISPMLSGVLPTTGDVAWNYGLVAARTFITLLPLLSPPALSPPPQPCEHPLKSLLATLRFLLASPLIGGIALFSGLLTMASVVHMLYPALAIDWYMSNAQIGLPYVAIPLGTAVDTLTNGQLTRSVRPGLIMLASTVASFLVIGLFDLIPAWQLGVVCLTLFGWLSTVSSLLQHTLLQTQAPETILGRINGLWTAQNVTGDAVGAALLSGLGAMVTPVASADVSGSGLVIVGLLLLLLLGEVRRSRQVPMNI